jgi:hypothetical protein
MKQCNKCEKELGFDCFNKNKNYKDGYMSSCRECRKKYRLAKSMKYKDNKPVDGKTCAECKTYKTKDMFSKDSHCIDRLQTYCKECQHTRLQNIYYKDMSLETYVKVLYKDLKRNAKRRNISVNITIDDIKTVYDKQKGLCALTNNKLTHNKYMLKKERLTEIYNLSVDRKDSRKGYSVDNIQLITNIANQIKSNASNQDFIEICKRVKNKCT